MDKPQVTPAPIPEGIIRRALELGSLQRAEMAAAYMGRTLTAPELSKLRKVAVSQGNIDVALAVAQKQEPSQKLTDAEFDMMITLIGASGDIPGLQRALGIAQREFTQAHWEMVLDGILFSASSTLPLVEALEKYRNDISTEVKESILENALYLGFPLTAEWIADDLRRPLTELEKVRGVSHCPHRPEFLELLGPDWDNAIQAKAAEKFDQNS